LGLILSTRNMVRIIIVCTHFECIGAGRRDDGRGTYIWM
jgi:hypothetical protein